MADGCALLETAGGCAGFCGAGAVGCARFAGGMRFVFACEERGLSGGRPGIQFMYQAAPAATKISVAERKRTRGAPDLGGAGIFIAARGELLGARRAF